MATYVEPHYVTRIPNPFLGTSSGQPAFMINEPNSVQADKVGLHDGDLLLMGATSEEIANLKEKKDAIDLELEDIDDKEKPEIRFTSFKNWGSTQEGILLYAKPTRPSQVKNLVHAVRNVNHKATEESKKIKIGMGGAYHSWSPVFPDKGGLIMNTCDLAFGDEHAVPQGFIVSDKWPDMDHPPPIIDEDTRIILHTYDHHKVVTISPGVTTGELMEFFLKYDVCFESDVILPTVTYGGVLSGGCHGVGSDQQSMSDNIVSMKVVNGKAEFETLSQDYDDDKGDEILAGQTSLGVLGVVLEFTIKVQDMSFCRVQNKFDHKFEEICAMRYFDKTPDDYGYKSLAKILKENWSVEIFWFPFNSILDLLLDALPKPGNNVLTAETIEVDISDYVSENATPETEVQELSAVVAENIVISPIADDLETSEHAAILAAGKFSFDIIGLLMQFWSPFSDKLWIRGIDIIRKEFHHTEKRHFKPSLEPGVPGWGKMMDVAVHAGGKYAFGGIQKYLPAITPYALAVGFQGVKFQYGKQADEIVRTPWAVHYRDAIDLMPVNDIEFAFPINIDEPKLAVRAIRKVMEITREHAKHAWKHGKKATFPLSLCLEMRVMKKSDCFLCPASIGNEENEKHIAYIEVLSTEGTPHYKDYFKEVAREWKILGGVPHWHKEFMNLDDDLDLLEHMQDTFGADKIKKFDAIRTKLDPDNVFLNSTMKKFFTTLKLIEK